MSDVRSQMTDGDLTLKVMEDGTVEVSIGETTKLLDKCSAEILGSMILPQDAALRREAAVSNLWLRHIQREGKMRHAMDLALHEAWPGLFAAPPESKTIAEES